MNAIAILSPGEMGTAVATRLAASGTRVVTCLAGRSEATQARAAGAGLECLPSLDEVVRQADVVVSLVTPFGAPRLAAEVAAAVSRTSHKPIYVDGNSISPTTAKEIGAAVEQAGAAFVDGGIIGGAGNLPRAGFYFSGPRAEEVAARMNAAVPSHVIGPRIGQASGLKILNAGLSKGLTALGVELLLCAQALDLLPEIMARYREAKPDVTEFWAHTLPGLPPKAARRAEEMQELTGLLEELGLTAHLSHASERVLAMVAERYLEDRQGDWEGLVDGLRSS
jgi:3-hydroxyisobutyrate dehydrogenase-like beta-hydroxyacid dehydrogenase